MIERVQTDDAPSYEAMDLPISQAIVHGDTVYAAGQVAVDPATGDPVDGGAAAQTEQIMENLSGVLEAAGTSLSNVVKATVFVEDMDDFGAVNEVYSKYVSEPYPARSAIAVKELAGDFDVEIEVVAAL